MKSSFVVAAAIGMFSASFAGTRTAVDFVETSANHYLILDYTPTSNAVVEVKVDNRNVGVNGAVFCARGNSTSTRTYTLFYITGNDGWRFDYYTEVGNKSSVKATAGTPVVLKTTPEGLYIDGVKKTSYSQKNFVAGNPMVLFASYQSATAPTSSTTYSNKSSMRLYSLKAWEDDVLKLDLQPFVNEKAVFGLYDAVSGKEYYPATAFSGGMSGMTLTTDPAIVENKANITYSSLVSGTGSNQLIVRGSGSSEFHEGVSNFGSFTIDGGTVVRHLQSGTELDDDLTIKRGRFYFNPTQNSSLDVSANLAVGKTITFGPSAEILLNRNNCKSATLNLGTLKRDSPFGTLFLRQCSNTLTELGTKVIFRPEGYSDGEILPAYIVGGRLESEWKLRYLKYDATKGIVAATMTSGLAGGADKIAYVNANTTLSADAAVKALVIDKGSSATTLTIDSGVTLTVGDGVNPSGLLIGYSGGTEQIPISGTSGTIDFGKDGIVWLATDSNGKLQNFSKSPVLKSSGSMAFVAHQNAYGSERSRVYGLPSASVGWTGATYLIGCYYNGALPASADSGDIYIEGNDMCSASLDMSNRTLNNRVHLSGPGLGADKWYALWTEYGHGYLNGETVLEHDAVVYSHSQYTQLRFNGPITGVGNLKVVTQTTDGTGYAVFTNVNTYAGKTILENNAGVLLTDCGTLGRGPLEMTNGRLLFNASGFVVTNDITGATAGRIVPNAGCEEKVTGTVNVQHLVGGGKPVRLDFAGSLTLNDGLATDVLSEFRASGREATLAFAGDSDYEVAEEISCDNDSAYALEKDGLGTVELNAAEPAKSVTVKAGTLKLADSANVLADTDSMCFWLDATDETTVQCIDGTTSVTNWKSKVGTVSFKSHSFLNPTSVNKYYPQYGTVLINGRKTLTFARNTTGNGGRARLEEPNVTMTPKVVFLVALTTAPYQWMGVFGRKDDDAGLRWNSETQLREKDFNDYAGGVWVDGVRNFGLMPFEKDVAHVLTSVRVSALSTTYGIGGYTINRDFVGQIGEAIAFNRALTSAERKQVERYLAAKWGVAVSGDVSPVAKDTAVTVASGATLDLNGHSAKVASLDGTGSIVNSSSTPVTVKVNARGRFKGTVGANVTVEFKKGMSVLIR